MKNAIIPNDFICGSNFRHGHNLIIEEDVVVGDNVTLGHNIVLKSGTRFGNNIHFGDYCCTTGTCILGNNIDVRTGAIISKAIIIEDYVFIGPGVMTNHTKHINLGRSKVPDRQYITRIGYGAVIGSSTGILAGLNIAANCIVGGNSFIVKDLNESGIYVGNPVRRIGDVPEEYFVKGNSESYMFDAEIIKKYLPNLRLDESSHLNISRKKPQSSD